MMSVLNIKRILAVLVGFYLLTGCAMLSQRRDVSSTNSTAKIEKKRWHISPDTFEGLDACFILYNLNSAQTEMVAGEARCKERQAPTSTFKVPLALMAFDSNVLRSEHRLIKWDGVDRGVPSWNRDHTPAGWMKESVLWYSQALTPRIGQKRIQSYLERFGYGNHDFSGGVEDAWLTPSPFLKTPPHNSLKINAYEQLEFMKKLWLNQLPVTNRAHILTRKITYISISPNSTILNGKTGSGFVENSTRRMGWFIGHIQKDTQQYITVLAFTDKDESQKELFAGQQAQELTLQILQENGLW